MKLLSKQYQFNQYLNRWVNEFEIIEIDEYIDNCYIPSNFDSTTYIHDYVIALQADEKIVENCIVKKTMDEQFAENIITAQQYSDWQLIQNWLYPELTIRVTMAYSYAMNNYMSLVLHCIAANILRDVNTLTDSCSIYLKQILTSHYNAIKNDSKIKIETYPNTELIII